MTLRHPFGGPFLLILSSMTLFDCGTIATTAAVGGVVRLLRPAASQ